MKSKRDITLYNMIFPIWMIILFPPFWLFAIPLNFIIDSIVFILSLKHLKMIEKKKIYRKSILKIFFYGFLSDIIGSIIIFMIADIDRYEDLLHPLAYEPATTPLTFLIMATVIAFVGILIYFLNKKFSFRKIDITAREKHKLSLYLAVFTAPYTYMLSYSVIEKIFG